MDCKQTMLPSIVLDEVEDPIALLVLAHGAGANMHHEFMSNLSGLLNEKSINVLRFNFPYMDKRAIDGKKYPPNRMPQLLECYQRVIDKLGSELPVFIAGKSMGGRVAATIAAQSSNDIKGVVCIGYPFHPAKKPEKLRLAPLIETQLPILILQGDRDALGSKEEIAQYEYSDKCQVVFFSDGDHDLKPRVKSGFTHSEHIETAVERIVEFMYEKM